MNTGNYIGNDNSDFDLLNQKQGCLNSETDNSTSNSVTLNSQEMSKITTVEVIPDQYLELQGKNEDSFTSVGIPSSVITSQDVKNSQTATINVTYNNFTPEAQNAFQYAVDIWESLIESDITIEIDANFLAFDSSFLGSAAPVNFYRNFSSATENTWYPVALANKLAGTDLDPDRADITANFNNNLPNWYFGTDGNTPAGQFDFVTVVLHELGHGLGFIGLMSHNNDEGSWGFDTGFPSIYDRFTVNGSSQSLTDTSLFPNPSNALGNQLISDNIFFNGSNAVAANGGTNPKLYAPGIWEETGSYGHLDEDTYEKGNPNSLMTPVIGTAEAIHHPGTITLGMFEDMGWTISSNVNQAPTDITITNSSVVEHQIGAVIGNLTVSDVDSTNFSYTLSDNRFQVVNSQLKLKNGVSLDFETENTINLQITATDDGIPTQSFTKDFAIAVTNLNEAPTNIELSNSSVVEHQIGAVIGNLTVTDVDSTNFTYTLSDNRFQVVNSQLKLKNGVSLDFETENTINLQITATDDGIPTQSFTKDFAIAVTNLNEGVEIAESDSSTDVSENGETDTYTVVLNSQPTSDVIINIDAGSQAKTDTNSLTFTSGNWNIAQTVTVRAIDDGIAQGNHIQTIAHTVNSSDNSYKDIKIDSINVNIIDNDVEQLIQTNSEIDIFKISGETDKPKLQITLTGVDSDRVNELGVFVVDDEQGSINGKYPDTTGYPEAALQRATIIFSALTNSPNGFETQNKTRLLEFDSGANIRFYLVDNSTTDTILSQNTSTSPVIFSDTTTLKVETLGESEFSLGWNDTNGNNFNDLLVKIQPTNQNLPLGTNLQNSSQGELIDLTDLTKPVVNAEFSVFREAGFNNEVYFYKVDDITGKVGGLTPEGDTYLQAALNNIVKDAITGEELKLSAANQSIETVTAQIETGSIIAPLIIVNGNLDQLTDTNSSNNPEVYFPYIGANTDRVDHIRLLADNTFGFEDLANGGDLDYNDLIVKVDFIL